MMVELEEVIKVLKDFAEGADPYEICPAIEYLKAHFEGRKFSYRDVDYDDC